MSTWLDRVVPEIFAGSVSVKRVMKGSLLTLLQVLRHTGNVRDVSSASQHQQLGHSRLMENCRATKETISGLANAPLAHPASMYCRTPCCCSLFCTARRQFTCDKITRRRTQNINTRPTVCGVFSREYVYHHLYFILLTQALART